MRARRRLLFIYIFLVLALARSAMSWAAGGFEEVSLGPKHTVITSHSGFYFTGTQYQDGGLNRGILIEMDDQGRLLVDEDGDNKLLTFLDDHPNCPGCGVTPADVNSRGVVVGSARTTGGQTAARWVRGRIQSIGSDIAWALKGDENIPWAHADIPTHIRSITESGEMLVASALFTTGLNWCALVKGRTARHLVDRPSWSGSGYSISNLKRPECLAIMANSAGMVVAQYPSNGDVNTDFRDPASTGAPAYHFFNGPRNLQGLNGEAAEWSNATISTLNDKGMMGGRSKSPDGTYHAVIWQSDGTIDDLGFQGAVGDINNRGEAVGYALDDDFSYSHFLYLPAPNYGLSAGIHELKDIGVVAWPTSAATHTMINDCGVIVRGASNNSSRVFKPQAFGCVPPETGNLVVQLDSAQYIATADEVQVQNAHVRLFQQSGFMRDKRPTETPEEYQAYLESQRFSRRLVDSVTLTPADEGRAHFRGVPYISLLSAGTGSARNWGYYTIEVDRASSEEIDLESGSGTNTVHFTAGLLQNVTPSGTSPPQEVGLDLVPVDGIPRKQGLIEQLSAVGPINYLPIENAVLANVNSLASDPGSVTDSQLDWLKRAILAERVTRDGARYVDESMTYMLKGLATLAGEVFDAKAKFTRKDIVAERKLQAEIEKKLGDKSKFGFTVKLGDAQYIQRLNVQKIVQDGDDADTMKKIFDLLSPLVTAVGESVGMSSEDAGQVTSTLMRTLKAMFSYVKERTAGGALKGELKKIIEDSVEASKPFLFDNAPVLGLQSPVDISYTGRTGGGLQYSLDRFSDWSQSDAALYVSDRGAVSEIEWALGEDATFVTSLAFALLEIAAAFDSAQKIFELGGILFKQFEAAAKFSEFMKTAGNGGAVLVPAVFIYDTAPNQVNDAAHQAYGIEPGDSP